MFRNFFSASPACRQASSRLILCLTLAASACPVAAATLQVDGTAGTDNTACGASSGAGACKTINYAVNSRAAAGDTIQATAGTYHEHVVVALAGLTLSGAQAGIDARTRGAGNETILDGATTSLDTGVSINASNVAIDGFTIQNYNAGGTAFGYGIVQAGTVSGVHVVNNILRGNGYTGLYMGCAGAAQCLAQHNLFDANQLNSNTGGDGIYSDSGTVNVLIDANKFTNHVNGSVIITGVASTTQNNITISNNSSVNDGLLAVFGSTNVTIANNTATNPIAGIRVDGSQHVSVSGNAILGGANTVYYAFRASNNNGFPNPVDDVTVSGNTFLASNYGVLVTNNFATPNDPQQGTALASANSLKLQCNRIVGNAAGGLFNASVQPSVTATQNWWGCNAGPTQGGCDTATGPNTNNPWLVLTLSATPNPVTIGGNSQLSASLNTDSNGATAACSLPDITPIAFSSSAGTISNPASHTSAGNAGANYVLSAPGAATASATVDNQTVNVTVTADAVSTAVPAPALSLLGMLALASLVFAAVAALRGQSR